MKPKSKSQAKRFKAMGAPERTPLSTDVLPFKRRIKELEREVAALEQERDIFQDTVKKLAALEQENHELNATPYADRIKESIANRETAIALDTEVERLRAAIRDALSDVEAGDFGGAANVLDRALTGECRCDIAGTDLCPIHSPSLYRTKPEGER